MSPDIPRLFPPHSYNFWMKQNHITQKGETRNGLSFTLLHFFVIENFASTKNGHQRVGLVWKYQLTPFPGQIPWFNVVIEVLLCFALFRFFCCYLFMISLRPKNGYHRLQRVWECRLDNPLWLNDLNLG